MPQRCLRVHLTSSLVITIDLKRHELRRTDDETACNRRAAHCAWTRRQTASRINASLPAQLSLHQSLSHISIGLKGVGRMELPGLRTVDGVPALGVAHSATGER